MPTDPAIQAAWISGLLQGVPTLLGAIAALVAINAWRPGALGQRKIRLAEECLAQAWELEREIRNARMPIYIGLPSYPPKMGESVEEQTRRVAAAPAIDRQFLKCLEIHKQFERTFSMAEFYIGKMPQIPFSGKMTFTIPYEYGMIIGQLRSNFLEAYGTSGEIPDKHMKKRIEAHENYFGWVTDCSDDEFTERLIHVKTTLERRMRSVLQHRSIYGKFQLYLSDIIVDAIVRRRKRRSKAKKRLAASRSERSI